MNVWHKRAVALAPLALLTNVGCAPEELEEEGVGSVTQAVIGGEDAPVGSHPWIAQIGYQGIQHNCGGALLAPDWVVTAGHCVHVNSTEEIVMDPEEFVITLGQHSLANFDDGEQVVGVSEVVPHPDYSLEGPQDLNDIALLHLDTSVELSDTIQIVRLASEDEPPIDDTMFAGWGAALASDGLYSPDILQQANLPVRPQSECNAYQGITNIRELVSNELCVGTGSLPATCNQDSGGPLTLSRPGQCSQLVGVLNWGPFGCGAYSVFAQVTYHADWIREYVPDPDVHQAEDMDASTGGPHPDGWNIWSNGYVSFDHDFAGGSQDMIVTASGQNGNGWPNMQVTVDGEVVFETTVASSDWTDYPFSFDAAAGSAEVRVYFTNDFYDPPTDRNLFLDKVTVVPSCAAPPPTSSPCDSYCSDPQAASWDPNESYQAGALGAGETCREVTQFFDGLWCGNFTSGKQLIINGTVMNCSGGNLSAPPPENGGYCIQSTAGDYPWASYALWDTTQGQTEL